MNKVKCVFLVISLVFVHLNGNAQSPFLKKMNSLKLAVSNSIAKLKPKHDSVAVKLVVQTSPVVDSVPTVKVKKQKSIKVDSSNLKISIKDWSVKVKNGFQKTWKKTFVDFTHNETFLYGGMNLSKQNINVGDYNSNFNYDLKDYNKDAYKPGYYLGYRVDGLYKGKHNYSFSMSLNKLSSGANYQSASTISPFLGSFSKFKADDQFFTLNIAAHYRKLLVLGDTVKRKFYVVAGPSFETRLSGQSADNLVNGNYHRSLLRADVGIEFNNQSYYTLFAHYKQGVTSFTKAPIITNLNTIELGIIVKTTDLF